MVDYFVERVMFEIDSEITNCRSGLENCSVEGIKTLRSKLGGLRWARQVIIEKYNSMKETDFSREEILG